MPSDFNIFSTENIFRLISCILQYILTSKYDVNLFETFYLLLLIRAVFFKTLHYNITHITVLYKTERILRKIFAVLSSEGK